jgi:hypothetical protein
MLLLSTRTIMRVPGSLVTHIATYQQDGASIEEVEEEEEPEAEHSSQVVPQLRCCSCCTHRLARESFVGVPVDTPTAGGGGH